MVQSSPSALVTGAATRVGRAIALALGRKGVSVAVHHHSNGDGATRICAELDAMEVRSVALQADLTDEAQVHRVVSEAHAAFGHLDLVVGSAANFERVPFDELSSNAWHRALTLNLTANYHLARYAAPPLRRANGSMVFITCSSTTIPMRNYLPYVVSKAGLKQMVRALSLELAPHVRVNAVAPGTVLPPPDMPADLLERVVDRIPAGRVGSASDVARAVLYLMDSPFVTGQELVVDGGRSVAGIERFT